MTWLYARDRGRIEADVVIRADGTPWPLDLPIASPGREEAGIVPSCSSISTITRTGPRGTQRGPGGSTTATVAGAPDGGPAATRRGPLPQVSRRLPRRAAPTLIRRSRRTPPGSRRLWSATREIRAQTPSESQGVAAKGDGLYGPAPPDTASDYRPAARRGMLCADLPGGSWHFPPLPLLEVPWC